MNAADRKKVDELKAKLGALKSETENVGTELRELADREQEKFDNMNESLQGSERGQAIESAAQNLDSAASEAEEGNANGALEALEEIEDS